MNLLYAIAEDQAGKGNAETYAKLACCTEREEK
jgi:hypothetical protein